MKKAERRPPVSVVSVRPLSQVLVVTDVKFWTLDRGSSRRIVSMIEYLIRHFHVSICYVGEMPVRGWNEAERFFKVPFFGPGQPSKLARRLERFPAYFKSGNPVEPNRKKSFDRQQPMQIEEFRSAVIGQYVGDLSKNLGINVVIIQYITLTYVSGYVRRQCPDARTIVDTHDVMHLRNAEFEEMGTNSWLKVNAEQERTAIECCDAAIAISDEDQESLQALVPGKPVLKVTYALPPQTRQGGAPSANNKTTLGFIGSDGDANRMGLADFLRESWPKLTDHFGDSILLRVAGPIDTRPFETDKPSNIEFIGVVDSLADFYGSIDIAINPTTIRSGFKIKSLEALAWGIPLVTTPAGIAGMSVAIGHGAIVADTWDDFAAALISIVDDRRLWEHAARDAHLTVTKYFSPDTVYANLVSWIGSVQ